MNIVVLDGYTLNPGDNPWTGLEKFGNITVYERTSPKDVFDRSADADILLTNKTPIDANLIAQLPKLKFIATLATGYNVVDIGAAAAKGIPVSNVPTYGTDSVAQHVFSLLLELCNHVGEHSDSVAGGQWSRCPDFSYWNHPVIELAGLTFGTVGMGRIGRRVAELAHAFGMKVLFFQPEPAADTSVPVEAVSLERLFSEADVISLHCNQTEENLEFVNRGLLSRMKPSAFLVNTSRGTLINEKDLIWALQQKVLAGAALDVLSKEPPDLTNPLLSIPNCLVTPHIAWSSLSARKRLMQTTIGNIEAFLSGAPKNVVNSPRTSSSKR